MNTEKAEILALEGLGWLVGNEDGLKHFLNLSGLGEGDLRAAAGTADLHVAVLDFLLAHEDLLLQFCESAATQPRQVHLARHLLGGEA